MAGINDLGVVSTRLLAKGLERHMLRFDARMRARFLAEMEKGHATATAARTCGLNPDFVRLHRKHDPQFDAECEAALDRAFDPALYRGSVR